MKRLYLTSIILCALFMQGCTNLKEQILNEKDNTAVISNNDNVGMLISPVYAYLRDLQSISGIWKVVECTTDEVCFPTRGTDWNNSNNRTLYTHTYTATNTYIKNCWNSLMLGITYSNTAINYLSQLTQTDEVTGYINEAKFVRALCMYYLMDNFGHFPMREADVIDFSQKPIILQRTDALERIISELEAIIPNLKEKGNVPYGRITKAAAQTLLAKVFLNYQVFTGTAPTFADGTTKFDEVINLCNAIINSGKYSLADDYWKLYLSDNQAYSDATETILPIIYNQSLGIGGQSWINNTLHYYQTFGKFKSMWNGCCTSPTFLNTWDTTDPRYQDDRMKSQIGFNLGILIGQQYNTNGTALTTRTGQPLIFTPEFSVENSTEAQGCRVVKYAPDSNYSYGSGSDNDFQYYRLADIYLMRCEAAFRKGDMTVAVADINTVRKARGMAGYTANTLTLEKIYNERGFEFYWDGPSRRDDMIRFNHYCEARYNKTESETYKILLPIPQTAIEANSEIGQNTGYN